MTTDNFTRVPESFPPQAAWPMPHELQRQPTRVSGAAQQVETDDRRSGHSKLQYDKTTRTIIIVDQIAAAERAVIEAAKEWHKCSDVRGDIETRTILHEAVKRLRAAREPKP